MEKSNILKILDVDLDVLADIKKIIQQNGYNVTVEGFYFTLTKIKGV